MDIKIPSGPPEGGSIDAVNDASQTAEAAGDIAEANEATPVVSDGISRIAEQVARGEIDRAQAVDQILAHVMDGNMVAAAPLEVRQELQEVLNSLLETDPYLRSLSAAIGPATGE
ncbi:MAG: hypothetical protein QNJ97_08000 [Myxococcota bacterium]|nr:hypothetical protein [Myxococcota bacterium]